MHAGTSGPQPLLQPDNRPSSDPPLVFLACTPGPEPTVQPVCLPICGPPQTFPACNPSLQPGLHPQGTSGESPPGLPHHGQASMLIQGRPQDPIDHSPSRTPAEKGFNRDPAPQEQPAMFMPEALRKVLRLSTHGEAAAQTSTMPYDTAAVSVPQEQLPLQQHKQPSYNDAISTGSLAEAHATSLPLHQQQLQLRPQSSITDASGSRPVAGGTGPVLRARPLQGPWLLKCTSTPRLPIAEPGKHSTASSTHGAPLQFPGMRMIAPPTSITSAIPAIVQVTSPLDTGTRTSGAARAELQPAQGQPQYRAEGLPCRTSARRVGKTAGNNVRGLAPLALQIGERLATKHPGPQHPPRSRMGMLHLLGGTTTPGASHVSQTPLGPPCIGIPPEVMPPLAPGMASTGIQGSPDQQHGGTHGEGLTSPEQPACMGMPPRVMPTRAPGMACTDILALPDRQHGRAHADGPTSPEQGMPDATMAPAIACTENPGSPDQQLGGTNAHRPRSPEQPATSAQPDACAADGDAMWSHQQQSQRVHAPLECSISQEWRSAPYSCSQQAQCGLQHATQGDAPFAEAMPALQSGSQQMLTAVEGSISQEWGPCLGPLRSIRHSTPLGSQTPGPAPSQLNQKASSQQPEGSSQHDRPGPAAAVQSMLADLHQALEPMQGAGKGTNTAGHCQLVHDVHTAGGTRLDPGNLENSQSSGRADVGPERLDSSQSNGQAPRMSSQASLDGGGDGLGSLSGDQAQASSDLSLRLNLMTSSDGHSELLIACGQAQPPMAPSSHPPLTSIPGALRPKSPLSFPQSIGILPYL